MDFIFSFSVNPGFHSPGKTGPAAGRIWDQQRETSCHILRFCFPENMKQKRPQKYNAGQKLFAPDFFEVKKKKKGGADVNNRLVEVHEALQQEICPTVIDAV